MDLENGSVFHHPTADQPGQLRDRLVALDDEVDVAVLPGLAAGDGAEQEHAVEALPEDAMIAGIALAHGTPVVTGNREHFERIEGLEVRGYE